MRAILPVLISAIVLTGDAYAASEQDWVDCVSGDHSRPIFGCTRVLADPNESPKNRAIAHFNRALAYAGAGQYDSAITDYTEAIRLDPKLARAYNNRGNSYFDKHDYKRAIADFDRTLGLDPNFVSAYVMRGLSHQRSGDVTRAISDFRAALAVPATTDFDHVAHTAAREAIELIQAEERRRQPEPIQQPSSQPSTIDDPTGKQPMPEPTISSTTALALGAIVLLTILGIAVKRDLSSGAKIVIAFTVPIMTGVIHYIFGVSNEIPLFEVTVLALPFGAALVAALTIKGSA